MTSNSINSLVFGYFYSILYLKNVFMLLHSSVAYSFMLLYNFPLYDYTTPDGYFQCGLLYWKAVSNMDYFKYYCYEHASF